ncbi:unnamed protein product [Cyprideis torosa]|uniref:Uncharacterized protein n=1 Tax=Cyprideis torosa TaxID=163714 RepID=A0A7R8WMQ5_9CRUS|nr:unnamed protein product [Cyprideis torosa]CAG0899598.1 unnamed protein product [Cyprideis torosa]
MPLIEGPLYYVTERDQGNLPLRNTHCDEKPLCPMACSCDGGVVDCREKGLVEIPGAIPEDTLEIRLELNQIQEIPPRAFAAYKALTKM